jgi:glycosyltransferase involved in cell wall biosynthesis
VARFVEETMRGDAWSHRVFYIRRPLNGGFIETANTGLEAAAPADVVLLNSDCIVADGWLEGLRSAVQGDLRIATATALTNAGTIVSVPERNHPRAQLPMDLTPDAAAAVIRGQSLRLHPDLPTCVGHCVYVRRSALELVGGLDPAFSPGYEEEVDFSQRCLIRGMRHVLADEVFVYHRHAGSFGSTEEVERLRWDHHVLVSRRYPYYDPWVEEVTGARASPLARALGTATEAMRGLSATIDGRGLASLASGTATTTLELILALDAHADVRLRVLVDDELDGHVNEILLARPHIELLHESRAQAGAVTPTDVVHRPHQVSRPEDIPLLRALGGRLIVTQLDHIALRNPDYFGTYEEWLRYRRITQASLAVADQVVFISQHVAQEGQALGLVDPERVTVIRPSTEPALAPERAAPTPPPAASEIGERPFLLVLGSDFRHKNRPFALALLEALVNDGWDGMLVLAGIRVSAGSSAGEEAAFLAARPQLARRALEVGAVSEEEKRWLLERCAAVLYPTLSEGFGLIPFEAARAGVPCLFAAHTSLADQLPAELATLVPWSAPESAPRVARVLADAQVRGELISGIRRAGAELTSAAHAEAHVQVYSRAVSATSPPSAALADASLRLQAELDAARAELSEIYDDPLNRGLAGRHAILPRELRAPVLAVASRPVLRAGAAWLYRVSHALNRRTRT